MKGSCDIHMYFFKSEFIYNPFNVMLFVIYILY